MATINLSIAQWTSEKSANDTNAQRMILGALRQNGIDPDAMTNQQMLDSTLGLMVKYLRDSAKAWEATEASNTASTEVIDNFPPPFEE